LDRLFSAAYEELRRLASKVRRHERGQTLNTTALVNEVYLKLLPSFDLTPQSDQHFKRIVVRAMRQLLVEAARRRQTLKRGSDRDFVTFTESFGDGATSAEEVLALDAALLELTELDPRQGEMVELHYFGGLLQREVAAALEVSESTVDRGLRAARAWLQLRLRPARHGGGW
jgi:RNA polymerase sigma factor (TIGR02999 family)